MNSFNGNQLLKLGEVRLHRWLGWVLCDWGIIFLSFLVMSREHNLIIWFLGMIVIGTRQHALAILGHDGTHGLAAKNRVLNDTLTNVLCFLPFGANLHSYQVVHLQHHNHLGSEKDPELDFKQEMAPQWDLPVTKQAFIFRFIKDLLGLGAFNVITIMKSMPIRRKRDVIYLIGFWIPTISILFLYGKIWMIGVWFLALFLSNWAVFRMRIWTEHIGTTQTHRIHTTWWQRWLFAPHNTWFHYEHHKWPWIPFYNLPQARTQIEEPTPIALTKLMNFYFSYKNDRKSE